MSSSVPEIQMPGAADIRDATMECISSFEACLSIKPLMKESWAESRLADLNLWASGVGALARPEASLDRRLQFLPKPRIVITNHLLTLHKFVESCRPLALHEIHNGAEDLDRETESEDESPVSPGKNSLESDLGDNANLPSSSASWFTSLVSDLETGSDTSNDSERNNTSDDQQAEVTLTEIMKDIDDLIDQLIIIGFAIRKSGTSARLYKADASFKPDENEDLRNHLEFIILNCIASRRRNGQENKENTEERMSGVIPAHGVTPEQQHLIMANLRRRHRFRYARRHHQKLDQSKMQTLLLKPKLHLQATENAQNTSPRDEMPQVSSDRKPPQTENFPSKELTADSPGISQPLELSDTAPSSVEGDILLLATGTSAAASRVSVSVTRIHYPSPPPAKSQLMRGFKCPCCYQTLPEMFKDWSRWRKHLVEDLCPYTCPFIECSRPEILYISRAAWRDHVLQAHGVGENWECLICAETETRNTFWSVEEFARHNRTEHKDAISEDQIIDLQDTCRKIAPPNISQCPLCSWPQDEETIPDATASLEHVGNCIHEFSLNALPWAESFAEDMTELLRPDIRRNIEEWLESNRDESTDIQNIDIKTFCFIPTPPEPIQQDTAFIPEEYFAESLISSQGTQGSLSLDDLPETIKTPAYDLSIRASAKKVIHQLTVSTWMCCRCGLTGMLKEINPQCIELSCQHPRCYNCTVWTDSVIE